MRRTASEVLRNLEMRIARLERQASSKVDFNDKYLMRVFRNQIAILTDETVDAHHRPFEMSRGGKIILEVALKGGKAVLATLNSWDDQSIDNMTVGNVYRKSIEDFSPMRVAKYWGE